MVDIVSTKEKEAPFASSSEQAAFVSVIVSNYNGSAYLPALLRSLQRQSLRKLEIIVIDDGSTDNSIEILSKAAQGDQRIRWEQLRKNSGPAGARNAGLAMARGKWVAIVDADDLIHPKRLELLIAKAEAVGADIIADDLLVFYENGSKPQRFLKGRRAKTGSFVSLEDYISENLILSSKPALGFLKPIFRRKALEDYRLRYNEELRIGEDFDLIGRALAAGLTYWIEPFPYYLYRRHSQSISHVLSNAEIAKMLSADQALRAKATPTARLSDAFAVRTASLNKTVAWNCLVSAIKERKFASALSIAAGNPKVLPLLALPVQARWRRLKQRLGRKGTRPSARGKTVCLISRQRLASAVNGSSRYVLSLVRRLCEYGYDVHLIHPSPNVFGRIPFMVQRGDALLFKSVRARGAFVAGPVLIAVRPSIVKGFVRGATTRVLNKLGMNIEEKTAPYSVAAPWEPEDYVFVARHAGEIADVVIWDYAFQTDAAPYITRPDLQSFVLMHDLFSSRRAQFDQLGRHDSVASIELEEELRLLTGADVVVAIQEEEAAFVKKNAPGHQVICMPIAATPAETHHPGDGTAVLFVGSKTAPNVDGLNWFLSEVWPIISAEVPGVHLDVVGSVCEKVHNITANVCLHGVVADLGPAYRSAGVVISPLLAGSGLKIKLIEALSFGKAIVATPVTLQGVAEKVSSAVSVSANPSGYAQAVVMLLKNDALRDQRASEALQIARDHFSAEACYREFFGSLQPYRKHQIAGARSNLEMAL